MYLSMFYCLCFMKKIWIFWRNSQGKKKPDLKVDKDVRLLDDRDKQLNYMLEDNIKYKRGFMH